ncbi:MULTISPECIES: hypothetical protein [Actinomycetes]|uniref:hypothetical protein n=1 Tax=Actinomycetes TaxID=1760 RepID=UPI0003B63D47|nr:MULTISPECIES: hypothetical protein [Actinomycetes]
MAKDKGYTLYTCDRCGTQKYLKDGDTGVSDFTTTLYLRMGSSEPTLLVLDTKCAKQFNEDQYKRDYGFDQYLAKYSLKKPTEANKAAAERVKQYEQTNQPTIAGEE